MECGFDEALDGKKRTTPPTEKILDGKQEAKIIAKRAGPPPKGYANWTLRLLARNIVELEIAEIRSATKPFGARLKNSMTNRKIEYWGIPPEANAEFAASMEEVLDTHAKTYNAGIPVLCMGEQPVQLAKKTRTPIVPTLHQGKRVDYEAFEPERARQLTRHIEFCYTPKHGRPKIANAAGVKPVNKPVKGTGQFWSGGGAEATLALKALWLSQDDRGTRYWNTRVPYSEAA